MFRDNALYTTHTYYIIALVVPHFSQIPLVDLSPLETLLLIIAIEAEMDQQRLIHEVLGIQSMFNNLMLEVFGLPYLDISSAMRSLFTNIDDRLEDLSNVLSTSTAAHSLKRDMPKG